MISLADQPPSSRPQQVTDRCCAAPHSVVATVLFQSECTSDDQMVANIRRSENSEEGGQQPLSVGRERWLLCSDCLARSPAHLVRRGLPLLSFLPSLKPITEEKERRGEASLSYRVPLAESRLYSVFGSLEDNAA